MSKQTTSRDNRVRCDDCGRKGTDARPVIVGRVGNYCTHGCDTPALTSGVDRKTGKRWVALQRVR